MATNAEYYFRGIAKWAKIHQPDPKFKNYTLDLYLDKDSFKLFEKSGLSLEVRKSDEGEFIKLRRPSTKIRKGELVELGPPAVMIGDDFHPFEGFVGNGSLVVCKVRVYDTMKGKGHELVSIHVENLVEYDKGEVVTPDADTLPF